MASTNSTNSSTNDLLNSTTFSTNDLFEFDDVYKLYNFFNLFALHKLHAFLELWPLQTLTFTNLPK